MMILFFFLDNELRKYKDDHVTKLLSEMEYPWSIKEAETILLRYGYFLLFNLE
jgi:hypothetical protein